AVSLCTEILAKASVSVDVNAFQGRENSEFGFKIAASTTHRQSILLRSNQPLLSDGRTTIGCLICFLRRRYASLPTNLVTSLTWLHGSRQVPIYRPSLRPCEQAWLGTARSRQSPSE